MQEFQKRVFEEKKALDDKLNRLNLFIGSEMFNELPDKDQMLLRRQENLMELYSDALAERIANFS